MQTAAGMQLGFLTPRDIPPDSMIPDKRYTINRTPAMALPSTIMCARIVIVRQSPQIEADIPQPSAFIFFFFFFPPSTSGFPPFWKSLQLLIRSSLVFSHA